MSVKNIKAGQNIIIAITEKECRGADFTSNENCPIAQAFKKRGFGEVRVKTYEIQTSEGKFNYVVSDSDFKRFGRYGRGSYNFIQPLIDKANNGETFTRHIKFQGVE